MIAQIDILKQVGEIVGLLDICMNEKDRICKKER